MNAGGITRSFQQFSEGLNEQSDALVNHFEKLLPTEIQSKIFGCVTQFYTLAKIALVSKDFLKVGWENHPTWEGFCRDTELKIADAKSYRMIFMCALGYRNSKALKCFSELYARGNFIKPDPEKAYHYLESILLEPPYITEKYKLDIILEQAQLKFDYRHLTKISDDNAFQKALNVSQNPNSNITQKSSADLLRAKMRINNRTMLITDNQAVQLLQSVSKNPNALPPHRVEAHFTRALMRIYNRTNLLTDNEAVLLLQGISQDPNTLPSIRSQVDHFIAQMCYCNRTNLLTHNEADQLMQRVFQNPQFKNETCQMPNRPPKS